MTTPRRHGISIVLPTMRAPDQCPLPTQFLASGLQDRLDVQFIFMLNGKQPRPDSGLGNFNGLEAIILGNDRYFGSCEENAYRSQDVARRMRSYVLMMGEHDHVDWAAMADALDMMDSKKVEVLGINILGRQMKADGAHTDLLSAPLADSASQAFPIVAHMMDGGVVGGRTGYAAMLNIYGPLDWAAYLGCHLYTRGAFLRMLSYRTVEHVYATGYKQMRYLADTDARYGFFARPVITRISEDDEKRQQGRFSWGWLMEHRRVHGDSSCFGIANLQHLNELGDDQLFSVIAHSRTWGQIRDNGVSVYRDSNMLKVAMLWGHTSLAAVVVGNSHYMHQDGCSLALAELRYLRDYALRLVRTWPGSKDDAIPPLLRQAASLIHLYLNDSEATEALVVRAAAAVQKVLTLLTPENMDALCVASFAAYADSLPQR